MAYRIMVTLRFRVRYRREIRRVKRESVMGLTRRGVPEISTVS